MGIRMYGPITTRRSKRVDRLEAILDFAVAVSTGLGLARISACVLGVAQDALLDNGMVQAAIGDWADHLDKTLRLLAAGVRYITGGK